MNNKNNWQALSMSERAFLIREAVRNGITDIGSIRDTWEHRFDGNRDIVDGGEIPSIVVTPDPKYTKFVNSLPDNQRDTPESEYYTHLGWKLYGKPEDFEEAKHRGMYHFDNSDQSYHGNSVAWDDKADIGYFLKPKHHETVKYELDWYNKGLETLEGGEQRPLTGKDREFWQDFKSKYKLDESGSDYKYIPRHHRFDGEENTQQKTYISKKPKNNIKTGNVEFDLRDVDTWRYHQAPTYSKDTDFTLAFTDALLEGEKNFKWGDKYYSTEVDYNKKFASEKGQKPFEEFANYMYPAVIKVLQENKMPVDMAHNIVRQAAMESDYGLSPRGEHGFNLSGIKWTPKAGDAGYDYTMEEDGEKYINFKNLKEYITYKVRTLNNNYNALEASNVYDYVEALHPKAFKKSPRSKNYKGDYSQGATNYKKSMTGMFSLDKTLMDELYFPLFRK